MKLVKVNKEKKEIKIKAEGLNETYLFPLRERLDADKRVEFANFYKNHPFLDDPTIYVRISSGKPQSALKRASKSLANDYEKLRKLFLKACTKYESED